MMEVRVKIRGRVQPIIETPPWDDRLAAKETMLEYGERDARRYGADWYQLWENGKPITAAKRPTRPAERMK